MGRLTPLFLGKEDKSPARGRKPNMDSKVLYVHVRKISPLQGDGNCFLIMEAFRHPP